MIGMGLLTSGCQLTYDTTRNLVFRSCLFTDMICSKAQYHHQANEAWKEYCSGHPDCAASSNFGKGFRAGYAEYLEEGGDTCPPPLPPMKYWKVKYQNAPGRMATKLWSEGYQAGASTAKASGARNFIVVPVNKCPSSGGPGAATPPPGAPAIAPGETVPTPAGPPLSPYLPLPASEKELPPPQPVPGDTVPSQDNNSPAANPKQPQLQQGSVGTITFTDAPPLGPEAGDAALVPTSSPLAQQPDAEEAPMQPIPRLLTGKSYPKNP
jgi:hypothetical protein